MSAVHTCNWRGKSGRDYFYWIYPLPVSFDLSQDGNYIFARLDAIFRWVPIYIGQGNLNNHANSHPQAACIRTRGASHLHGRVNRAERDRLAEEGDLLANYTQAYQPTGCNERSED